MIDFVVGTCARASTLGQLFLTRISVSKMSWQKIASALTINESGAMKKFAHVALLATALATATTATSCYGSYGAFQKVHHWNGSVTSEKFSKSVLHFALWIIPVYELAIVGDWLIFNNIEFITGENPLK